MPIDGESYTTIISKHRPQAMPLAHHEEVQGIPLVVVQKYKTFKGEFTAILNWPLMPTEFEYAWAKLVHKYNLENDQMMMHL